MNGFSEYDGRVKRLNRASVAAFAALSLTLFLASASFAQINGVPSSVTSVGFGGHPGSIHGVAPSVTSLGPRGYTAGPHSSPGGLFGVNSGHNINGHHRPGRGYYPYGGYYAAPYYGYYDNGYDDSSDQSQAAPADQYNGGPTIFDRRGSGPPPNVPSPYSQNQPAQDQQSDNSASAEPAPASEQTPTVLIFKDGHQQEVENYAIVGSTLYDLSDGRRRKIALADLDLTATAKQNEDRGLDFQLPAGTQAN